jgi:4-hydroxy-3-polyprenylbenzoate decarboxylase
MAISMGLDPNIEYEALIPIMIERYHHPIMPVKVTTALCKEVVETGADVNLFKFPFPWMHKEDGGRYGTGVLTVKDLDSDWQNWGDYRFMIAGHDRIVADFLSEPSFSRDVKAIYNKYAAVNRAMPFAFVLGGAPTIMIAAAQRLPSGLSEIDYAGGLNLDPINLVKAETSDLLVPGDAEIVIEGEVIPGEMIEDGPYGSIKGYTPMVKRPLMKVTAVTHRKDPILPIIVDGTKTCDTQVIISMTEASLVTRWLLEDFQMGMVRWFQIPADWNISMGVCSIVNMVNGIIFRIVRHIFSITNLFDKVIFVDADVHPTSQYQIFNDWAQKVHPIRDNHLLTMYPPAVMPRYGEVEPGKGCPRFYVDACWPAWYTPEDKPTPMTFENIFPEELQQRVVKRWKEEFKIPVEPKVLPKGQR